MKQSKRYHHIQRAPICWLLYALGFLFAALAWILQNEPFVPWVFLAIFPLLLLLAGSFHYLSVQGDDADLKIGFGPLPIFRRDIRYEDIIGVEPGRTDLIDGLGIHMSLKGGWVWNIWGRDCVVLKLRKGTFRLGTDQPQQLAQFIESQMWSVGSPSEPIQDHAE
jgi:hypothetical protein